MTETLEIRMITPLSAEWPKQLNDLDDPPEQLYLSGPLRLHSTPQMYVAVIGSRSATAYGQHVAHELAQGLAHRGRVVVSGGAYGIDAAAHRGAMSTQGTGDAGVTVCVLANGLDKTYPTGEAELHRRIQERGGVLVSEYEPGTVPSRTRFLARNRIVAALAGGVVVVEAARRSGSLAAMGRARGLGRVRMAVPGPVTSAYSAGCHDMIRAGARLVTDAEDVLEAMNQPG